MTEARLKNRINLNYSGGYGMTLDFRKALKNEISNLVNLHTDGHLNLTREDVSIPLNQGYIDVFHSI